MHLSFHYFTVMIGSVWQVKVNGKFILLVYFVFKLPSRKLLRILIVIKAIRVYVLFRVMGHIQLLLLLPKSLHQLLFGLQKNWFHPNQNTCMNKVCT